MKRSHVLMSLAILVPGLVWAQAYPTKVITIIVPFSAGGPTDTVTRLLAQSMGKTLGQQVIVENVGGTIGATRAAKAAPDGYTLLLHHIGMATAPALSSPGSIVRERVLNGAEHVDVADDAHNGLGIGLDNRDRSDLVLEQKPMTSLSSVSGSLPGP